MVRNHELMHVIFYGICDILIHNIKPHNYHTYICIYKWYLTKALECISK